MKKKKMMKSKSFRSIAILASAFLLLLFAAILLPNKEPKLPDESIATQSQTFEESPSFETLLDVVSEEEESSDEKSSSNATPAPSDSVGTGKAENVLPSAIPEYSGKPFVVLNDNVPNFSADELKSVGFESYSALDVLGRTGTAIASVGLDTMPKEGEKRGSISAIKPSGWNQASYDHISGKYLYNRCHLIGWQLSAENANERNLITGTKYLNISGMLPFENMVADYIKETSNHVAYRITPIYQGENLLPKGVEMEAYSVEDSGEGISFHVFCYNVQPGVKINYSDGSSALEKTAPDPTVAKTTITTTQAAASPVTTISDQETVFITKSGKRYHSTSACSGLNNAKAIFESGLAEAKKKGLTPCSICY